MKPDDEYEDAEQNTYVGSSRAMSWLVLAVAVTGFASLAYYAYESGAERMQEASAVVIEADGSPIKTTPETADGEQFPNQDKTIYDVIAPDGQRVVEKLMPDAEHPVVAGNVEDSEDAAPVVAPSNATVASVAKPPVAAPAASATTFVAADRAPAVAPVVVPKPVEKSYAAPEMINEKKSQEKPEKKVAATEATKKPPAQSASPAASGAHKIQLGAYGSEAEAQAAWKKVSGKFSSVLTGEPTIVKAEVNGKTYYRLRAGSFASSADAKAECAKLAGQACMAVR